MSAKGKCSVCKGIIEFDESLFGTSSPCPYCGRDTILTNQKLEASAERLKALAAEKAQKEFDAQAKIARWEAEIAAVNANKEAHDRIITSRDYIREIGAYERPRDILDTIQLISKLGFAGSIVIGILCALMEVIPIWLVVITIAGAAANLVVAILANAIGNAIFDTADCAIIQCQSRSK
jgi:hypothetical protein